MTATAAQLVARTTDDASASALAAVIVDGVVSANRDWLEQFLEPLRDAIATAGPDLRGWLCGTHSIITLALAKLPSQFELEVQRDARAGAFLVSLLHGPKMNARVRGELHASPSAISRTGRLLVAHGLVEQTRIGREVQWSITARGRVAWRKIVGDQAA